MPYWRTPAPARSGAALAGTMIATLVYDLRGRVTQETKVISGTGGGTFVTKWDYDAVDRVVWQKYPGGVNGEIGEQVNTTYTAQGLVKSVSGANVYVGDTLYNVRGQVSERRLGSTAGVVKQFYDYAAPENFRLTAFRSGVSPNYNTLQNVAYSYDDAGNVLSISDAAAYGGSQTQQFSYDALDRLATAPPPTAVTAPTTNAATSTAMLATSRTSRARRSPTTTRRTSTA